MKRLLKKLLLALPVLIMLSHGCAPAPQELPDEVTQEGTSFISTARELEYFFLSGGNEAKLTADIDMKDTMLKLTKERGSITILGDGHTLKGNAPCVIRLEDGCLFAMEQLTIETEQIGIGLLGAGTLQAQNCTIKAASNAIEAPGALTLAAGSNLTLSSSGGSAIICLGITLMENSSLTASGDVFALSAGRGDILLKQGAKAACTAYGDNAVKTDGALHLMSGSHFASTNPGEHNAAKVGSLQAEPDATLELTGGINGVGLFVIEQRQDVSLRGFCKPVSVRVEVGKGIITFTS